jgi:hypothetical protein
MFQLKQNKFLLPLPFLFYSDSQPMGGSLVALGADAPKIMFQRLSELSPVKLIHKINQCN